MDDVDPRQLISQGIESALHLDSQAEVGVMGQDMVGKGVAAHEGARIGCARADDSHSAQGGSVLPEEGKCGSGVEQDHRPLRNFARE